MSVKGPYLHLAGLLLLAILLAAVPASAQTETAGDGGSNVYGVVEGFWLPDVTCELNPGWERIIFDWSQHQPDGPDDWNTLNVDDKWLKAAQDCHREVVGLLKNTPKWATDGTPGPGLPRGLNLPVDDPNNLWATFVRKAAAYYAPHGVNRFIIWNEPDISRETYGFEFEGSVDDYAQLLKVAYLAAHEGNPNVIIHVAGTTYWHDVNVGQRLYVDRLLEKLTQDPDAAANHDYFDVLSLHIYFRADTVYQIVGETHALLKKYGLTGKSIWIDETNASPNLDPEWPMTRPNWQITLDQQAAYLVQAVGLGLAAGADHIGVYKFYDWMLPPGGEPFGLLRADGSRRPAFNTWKMVIQHLNGVQSAALARTDGVDAVRLTQADGQQTLIVWARTAAQAQIMVSATGSESTLLDQYGKMVTLRPINGAYTLSLPGATCNNVDGCPVGGMPSLLVQPQGNFTLQEMTPAGLLPLDFEQEYRQQ